MQYRVVTCKKCNKRGYGKAIFSLGESVGIWICPYCQNTQPISI